jgi:hypothetical protein
MSSIKILVIRNFFLVIFLMAGSAAAISVRTVNLNEMVLSADRVFLGKVVRIDDSYDSRLEIDVTVYTFSVLEGIRGPKTGDTVQIRQVGSRGRKYSPVPGLPGYSKGQEVLLFLHGDSRFGLTSPVGLSQGVFRAIDKPDGRKGYVNGVGNRNLNASGQPAYKSIPPAFAESGSGLSSSPVPITIEMVRDLVAVSEGKRE